MSGGKKKSVDRGAYMAYNAYMSEILLRNVPEELRKAFKLLCIERNTNMTEVILKFMREEVEKAKSPSH